MIPPEVMTDMILRLMGATAGSALALVYNPPRTKEGFTRRVTASMICGVVFPGYVQSMVGFAKDADGMIAAACLTSFVAWWAMDAIIRVVRLWNGPKDSV